MNMKDKVVIVTGGSSGIGEACAESFAKAGAKVVITGRSDEKLAEAKKTLIQKGCDTILTISGDVSSEEDCNNTIIKVLDTYGKIDVLINNAGISMRSLFDDIEIDVFKQVMNVNFYGALYMTKSCLSHIKKTKGSIIGISSIAGKKGLPARTAYSASKFAMEGFLQALRIELIHDEVHVLVVSPGFVKTNIRNTALKSDGSQQGQSPKNEDKLMTAEEVAEAVLIATVKRKRDLILTTQGKTLVQVNKFAPSLADKQVYKHFANEPDSPLKK